MLISTKYGIYEPNCGLDNIFMSWGHDGKLRLNSLKDFLRVIFLF